MGAVLEFLSIPAPHTFIGIQGEDRDEHPIPFGDPDRFLSQWYNVLRTSGPSLCAHRIPVPFERGIMSSFIATLEVDGMGGYSLSPSLTT